MTNAYDDVHKQLHELRELYLATLPEKFKQLEISFLNCTSTDGPSLMNFFRTVHSLAGSASIYSITEISDIARQIEDLVSPIVNGDTAPADWRQNIEVLLDKIKAHIEALTPPQS